jgi:N-acetylneuraminic acid mutarotase
MSSQKIILMARNYLTLLITLIMLSTMVGCSEDDSEDELIGNWIELSDFEGVPRSDAVAFTIGNKAYVGTGYDGEDRLTDFWEYDADDNNWMKKADFPGIARNGAVGFGTDSKGYIGTGYDGTDKLNDFWEYDPVEDSWRQVADFGGTARYGAVAFAINNKGYVCTGYDDNALKDLWEYDPATDEWTQKISLSGGKRRDAIAFVIDGKGYICTGVDNGVYEDDFWQYDPDADTWTKKRSIADVSDDDYDDDYSGIKGTNKVAFTINGIGYVATGGAGTTGTTLWQYNPSLDLWEQKTSLEASSRIEAIGFSLGSLGFVATGRNASYYFDDLWGIIPHAEQKDLDKALIVDP